MNEIGKEIACSIRKEKGRPLNSVDSKEEIMQINEMENIMRYEWRDEQEKKRGREGCSRIESAQLSN